MSCRKKDQAMKQHYLLVNILDASGSMSSLTNATIRGYNQYLQTQEGKGVNLVYTVTFNTRDQVIREFNDLTNGQIDHQDYQANGGTALFDAIGKTVTHIDRVLKVLSKEWKVIVNIITDGLENASRSYTEQDIQNLIEDHQSKGWLFMYVGAHKEAKAEGKRMRIRPENIVEVEANEQGIKNSFAAFESSTYLFKKGK
jgi:uncharacterized protein YegL